MDVIQNELESNVCQEVTSINVLNLTYLPSRKLFRKYLEYLRYELTLLNLGWMLPFYKGTNRKLLLLGAELHNVSFKAVSGELTAILGEDQERCELIELIAGRKKTGSFDGHISLNGPNLSSSSYYYDNVTFVQNKSLFIPGLTYLEMIRYATKLRVDASKVKIDERIDDIINIMNLNHCKDRHIPAYPSSRGEAGCEMRRLSIAIEIVNLPPLIVMDDPTQGFEPATCVKILECLQTLAKRGHIVLIFMSKPTSAEFSMLDRVVLISEGYTIYSAAPNKIEEHFCSPAMGYERKKGIELVDFTQDVRSGMERPITLRAAELPSIMQEKFEVSPLFDSPSFDASTHCNAFCKEFFFLFGYTANTHSISTHIYRTLIVIHRAFMTKLKNTESLQSYLGASFVLSTIIGYLQYQQGQYGSYSLSLLGVPYLNTENITSALFILSMFTQAFFFNDTHTFCQKLQVFRYEQAAGCCTVPAFCAAMVLTEVPFGIMFSFCFINIIYFMMDLQRGLDNYSFFVSTLLMSAMVGLSTTVMMCAIFKKELIIRDMFFCGITLFVLMSGFPVQQQNMPKYLVSFSEILPTRWVFEAMMVWYFSWFKDGAAYLKNFSYQQFDHSSIFTILIHFLVAINLITIFFLLPAPILMKRLSSEAVQQRRGGSGGASRDSITSNLEDEEIVVEHNTTRLVRANTRNLEGVQPIMFMRQSTVTGRTSKLSVNLSQLGEENTSRGPTVQVSDLTYRVRDTTSPVGYKTILDRVTAQFDWGKLSMVLGAPHSGKTSLLHLLAGDVGAGTSLEGSILFNGKLPATSMHPWERCGFVPMQNEHFRDLTVHDVVSFAMKLRCYNALGLRVLEENVESTLEILHLTGVVDKKVKYLNKGEFKRLSIAEEMVHGPKLLFMDEPTTGVSLFEASVLLLTFREMVNADRTVVASMYQPTPDAFRMFDNLLLLSKGRVIYAGKISNATDYFVNSPYQYFCGNYSNPADFLVDISGSQISDSNGEFIDASLLEAFYKQTEAYKTLRTRTRATIAALTRDSEASTTAAGSDIHTSAMDTVVASTANPLSYKDTTTSATTVARDIQHADDDSEDGSVTATKHKEIREKIQKPLPTPILALLALFQVIRQGVTIEQFQTFIFKRRILLHRSALAIWQRYELVIGSFILHILLALLFAWIIADATPPTVIAYIGIAVMFLILANVQFIFFTFNNHQVFLKEHTRGLYNTFTHFSVNSLPVYLLKAINGVLFLVISWTILGLPTDADIFGFAVLCFATLNLCGTMLSEVAIFTAPDLRSCYLVIPAVAFLNFIFSGLFIKAGSLPDWMAPWTPSLSVIRWMMQANFIAIYENDTNTFPTILNTNYSIYIAYLSLFGWGGKTKWYCFGMVVIAMAIYRVISLFACGYSAFAFRGTHKKISAVHAE